MTVVYDTTRAAARHPPKKCIGRTRLRRRSPTGFGQGAAIARIRRNRTDRARERPAHRVRGGRLPQYRRCWEQKHATFMILGDTCTRACAFCNVKTGLPGPLDPYEPAHVAERPQSLASNMWS